MCKYKELDKTCLQKSGVYRDDRRRERGKDFGGICLGGFLAAVEPLVRDDEEGENVLLEVGD